MSQRREEGERSKAISIVLPADVNRMLRAIARSERRSLSQLASIIIEDFVIDHEKSPGRQMAAPA